MLQKNSTSGGHVLRIAIGIIVLFISVGGASALSNDGSGTWQYYRDITINNPGSALTDYQVLVTLDSSNFPTGAQTDGDDIRFELGGVELNYWFEKWDYAGKNAKVWLNVKNLQAGGNSIRMFYGNPSATQTSNGESTFSLFEDWEGTGMNGWTFEPIGGNWIIQPDPENTWNVLQGAQSISEDDLGDPTLFRIYKNVNIDGSSYFTGGLYLYAPPSEYGISAVNGRSEYRLTINNDGTTYVLHYYVTAGPIYSDTPTDKWFNLGSINNWVLIQRNIKEDLIDKGIVPGSSISISLIEMVGYKDQFLNFYRWLWDEIYFRKYTSSEPTISSIGAETPGKHIPGNNPPIANNDAYNVDEDSVLSISAPGVLENDADVDGDKLSVLVVSYPAHGTLTLNSNGGFTYSPTPNYNGPDSFTYKANDGSADSNVAAVSITVNPVGTTNLALSINAPERMDPGNIIIYTLYFTNIGNVPAENVKLEATLPSNVDFESASDGVTPDIYTRKVIWNLNSFIGGGSKTLKVRIPFPMDYGTLIQSTFKISTSTPETNINDNDAIASTRVVQSPVPWTIIEGSVPPISQTGTVSVSWHTPITFLFYNYCRTQTEITFINSDGFKESYSMSPKSTNLDIYTYTKTFSSKGYFTVTISAAGTGACMTPSSVTFNLYVDPAGYIYDVNTGERIAGASVWLQLPDGNGGWENVQTGQSPAVMQPDENPLITEADGQYQWDVLEGSYRVHVEADGYYPADSIVVSIPPPVTDLHVGLTHTVYNFNGFFQPVDNIPTLNTVKAGSTIPIKFSLNGNQGLTIFTSGYPKSQKIYCDTGAPMDEINETVTAGQSSLSYDATADQYNYIWKTDKAWSGTCLQMIVRLNDGTDHMANFKFR